MLTHWTHFVSLEDEPQISQERAIALRTPWRCAGGLGLGLGLGRLGFAVVDNLEAPRAPCVWESIVAAPTPSASLLADG